MKVKKSRLLVWLMMILIVAIAVSGASMTAFGAGEAMTASISSQPSGAALSDKSDINIVVANSGNTSNFTGAHRNTAGNFDDFIKKIKVKKLGADYKTFDEIMKTLTGASINIQSGNMHVHGLSLTAGEVIMFDTGFRFIKSTPDNWGGDVPASYLSYTDAPALTSPIIFERLSSGQFLVVGENPVGITVPNEAISIVTGEEADLGAKTSPINATNNTLTYESDNTAVATVSADGKVTGVTAGTATITIKTSNNLTKTVAVTVTQGIVEVTEINLEKDSATLTIGTGVAIKATVSPADASDKALTYTSSDSKIAQVNENGAILAKKSGTATITVKAHNDVTKNFTVTVSPERTDVKVKSYANQFTGTNVQAFTFDWAAGSRDGNDINNLRGRVDDDGKKINDYIWYNGKTFDKTSGLEFQFWSGAFYANGFNPVEGDTLEFKAGLHFPYVSKDSVYNGTIVYKDVLGEDFKVLYTNGSWTRFAEAGTENKIVNVSKVNKVAESVVDVARYSFNINFDILIVDSLVENLQDVAAYADNLFIGGKSVAAINAEFKAEHEDEGEVPAIKLSAISTILTVNIAQSVTKNGAEATIIEDGNAFELILKKEFVSTTGMIHTTDYVRYYVSEFDFWSTIKPYAIEKTADVYVTNAKYSVIDGGINGCIDLTFNENIATSALLGYGIHPMYLISSSVPAGFGAKGVVNGLVSSGAAHNVFNKLLINGKSISEYWTAEEIGSYEAKSDRFQIHITALNTLSLRTNVSSTFGPSKDITITLPKGFMFYSGATLNEEMIIKYVAETEEISIEYGVSIAPTADKTAIYIGEKATILSGLDEGSVLPLTFESDNDDVLTVDENGVVTAVAKGTATITVTCGDKSGTITITVNVAVTSVTVAEAEVNLTAGENATIQATVNPSDATDKTITYQSDNTAVATVDANGKITAVSAGTATITVSCGGKTTTVTVTVTAKEDDKEDVGCTSSGIAAGSVVGVFALLALAGVALKKRKQN